MTTATRKLLLWLGPILLLAAVLRVIGIGHGLPFAMMGDEAVAGIFLPGGSVMAQAPLVPWLYLPFTLPVLAAAWLGHGFRTGAEFGWVVFDATGAMLLAARLGAVALSLATVALVALTARRLFGDRLAGIAAGLLMATCWLSAALAHGADRWTPMAFFIWLTVYIALRYGNRPGPRRALLLGLAAGLGTLTGPAGGLGLLAGLVVHLVRYRGRAINANLAWLLAPALVMGGLFITLGWPATGGEADLSRTAGVLLATAWWADPLMLGGGLIGMALLLRRHAGLVGLMLAAAVLWTLVITWTASAQNAALLPLLPVFALAAGGGVLWLAERLPLRTVLPAGLAGGLALLYPLATAGMFSLLLAADDTREQAAGWLETHLAPGSAVVVDLAPVSVPATLDGLLDQELYLSGSLDSRMALAMEGGWPENHAPTLRAVHVDRAAPEAINGEAGRALFQALRQAGYDTLAIALREGDPTLTGLERAVFDGYERLALFLTADDDAAPRAPDPAAGELVDGPVWRLFLLDRLGPSALVARVSGS
jgi:hypothetical protein